MLSYSRDNQGPDVGKFKSEFPSDFHISKCLVKDYFTQRQNQFKKWKKHSPMVRFELLMLCASRGGCGGAPDHSAIQLIDGLSLFSWWYCTPISDLSTKLTTFSAIDFFELGRVEASHWTRNFLAMFTFIFRSKNVRHYCHFCHERLFKFFCQALL